MKLYILTYSPTGLGHLRVTDAIISGLPHGSNYLLLSTTDKFITWVHRFTSINPFGKFVFLSSQYGFFEKFFTYFYKQFLYFTAKRIQSYLFDILKNREEDEFCFISTHFAMAHQLGFIKNDLAKSLNKKVTLVVQVTDDTFQRIWCVKGTDLLVVPSFFTRDGLQKVGKETNTSMNIEVVPYPLCNRLTSKGKILVGSRRLSFQNMETKINIALPISGAAVGTDFLLKLIKRAEIVSTRFVFWIVIKASLNTRTAINAFRKYKSVKLLIGNSDAEMILLYERLYSSRLIHIEVTKPSEQLFKAMIPVDSVGGSILLFTEPVGRQEIDNLAFLNRHGVLFNSTDSVDSNLNEYRAVKLSNDPVVAADFICKSTTNGLFESMSSFNWKKIDDTDFSDHGVDDFWKLIIEKSL